MRSLQLEIASSKPGTWSRRAKATVAALAAPKACPKPQVAPARQAWLRARGQRCDAGEVVGAGDGVEDAGPQTQSGGEEGG